MTWVPPGGGIPCLFAPRPGAAPLVLLGDRASEVGVRHPRDGDIARCLRRCHGRSRCQQIGSYAGVERDDPYLPRTTVKRACVARPDTGDAELTRCAVGHLVERVLTCAGRHLRGRNHGADYAAVEEQASVATSLDASAGAALTYRRTRAAAGTSKSLLSIAASG